jgi:hypothetical protein
MCLLNRSAKEPVCVFNHDILSSTTAQIILGPDAVSVRKARAVFFGLRVKALSESSASLLLRPLWILAGPNHPVGNPVRNYRA